MAFVRVVMVSFLGMMLTGGAAAAEWRQVKVPGPDGNAAAGSEPVFKEWLRGR
jgi:hypothetical protein